MPDLYECTHTLSQQLTDATFGVVEAGGSCCGWWEKALAVPLTRMSSTITERSGMVNPNSRLYLYYMYVSEFMHMTQIHYTGTTIRQGSGSYGGVFYIGQLSTCCCKASSSPRIHTSYSKLLSSQCEVIRTWLSVNGTPLQHVTKLYLWLNAARKSPWRHWLECVPLSTSAVHIRAQSVLWYRRWRNGVVSISVLQSKVMLFPRSLCYYYYKPLKSLFL